MNAGSRLVAVFMAYQTFKRHIGNNLIYRNIELDPRQRLLTSRRHGAAIEDTTFGGLPSSGISVNVDDHTILWNLDTTVVVNPFAYRGKDFMQEIRIDMRRIAQGEIEVFRKPVCFKIAFLQACASLEYPCLVEFGVRVYSGKQPAQYLVLFHHMRMQINLSCLSEDFVFRDHSRSQLIWRCEGTNRRHRVTSLSPGEAGSSCALPAVKCAEHSTVTG